MSAYHCCARETPSCKGLNAGVPGYHDCARKKNCKKEDLHKRRVQKRLKKRVTPAKLKQGRRNLKPFFTPPTKTDIKRLLILYFLF